MIELHRVFRGVLVYLVPKSDIHQQIGFYTEEGMIYVTAYGSRKSKNLHKRTLSLFSMGKILVSKQKNNVNVYVFKEMEIYRKGDELGKSIPLYYSASFFLELVRALVGADHSSQFKLLVDVLLYLIDKHPEHWKESLVVFLWQSLANNGWQPDFSAHNIETFSKQGVHQWVLYHSGKLDPCRDMEKYDTDGHESCVLDSAFVSLLQILPQMHINSAIHAVVQVSSQSVSRFTMFLIQQWKQLLDRNLFSLHLLKDFL